MVNLFVFVFIHSFHLFFVTSCIRMEWFSEHWQSLCTVWFKL